MVMDYFKSLETFVSVAKRSSFSAASAEIGISRAMVTSRINALEDRLGSQLFSRTTRHVSLTEPGQRFYEFSTRLLHDLADEELSLATHQQSSSGSLRVIGPNSFGRLHLGSAMAQFCKKHPEFHIRLDLIDLPSSELDLAGDAFDVAIQLSIPSRTTAIGRQIASLRWAVCASPAYLKQHGTPKEPRDLIEHNCLLNSGNFPDRFWRFGSLRNPRTIKLKGNFSGNIITLRDAAIEGLGIALLPLYCADEALRTAKLVHILKTYTLPDSPLYVLVRGNKYIPRKVRVMTAFLAKWARTTIR
jgi:DNA-binding transcriptional LysR family regulator